MDECAAAFSPWVHIYYPFMTAWIKNFNFFNIQRNVRKKFEYYFSKHLYQHYVCGAVGKGSRYVSMLLGLSMSEL